MEEQQRINDDIEIAGILKALQQGKVKLWCWQLDDQGLRVVHHCTIQKVNQLNSTLLIRPCSKYGFRFCENKDIFFYAVKRGVACKLKMRDYNTQQIIVPLPTSLIIVEDNFASKLELVEKDNESLHIHERSVPRKKAREDQTVGLRRFSNDQLGLLDFHDLYDMSAGGMGIKVIDPAEFSSGDCIKVEIVDGNEVAKDLFGEVVSVRQSDNDQFFKVGIKFV